MSDRDALVLTLVRGLEHAATALDVVNDATRQEVGALLSPKARQLLAALTAPATPADAADDSAPAAKARSHRSPRSRRRLERRLRRRSPALTICRKTRLAR